MNKEEKAKKVVETIHNAKNISILPSKIGGADPFCAGVGLYHVLKDLSKSVQLIYQGKVPDGCEDMLSKDEVVSNIKHKELYITIDYNDTKVETVQYTAEDGIFYLKLAPIDKNFDMSKIRAEIVGHKSDVFVMVGAQDPEDLGQTYHELEKEILTGSIINIDNTERNSRWGHFNIVDPAKDSNSLLTMHTLLGWDFNISTRAAEAFLKGVSHRKI